MQDRLYVRLDGLSCTHCTSRSESTLKVRVHNDRTNLTAHPLALPWPMRMRPRVALRFIRRVYAQHVPANKQEDTHA